MATDGHHGRRELLRAQVEQAALELFQQHGVEAVTVEQICAAAGIAAATFYRHYGTKAGVLFAHGDEAVAALRAAVAGAATTSGPEQLRHALSAFARHLDAQAPALRARSRLLALNPVLLPRTLLAQREWEDELAAALADARGVPAGDPDVRWEAALGLVVVRAAMGRSTGGCSTMEIAVAECFAEAVAAVRRLTGEGDPPTGGSTPA